MHQREGCGAEAVQHPPCGRLAAMSSSNAEHVGDVTRNVLAVYSSAFAGELAGMCKRMTQSLTLGVAAAEVQPMVPKKAADGPVRGPSAAKERVRQGVAPDGHVAGNNFRRWAAGSPLNC